MTDTLTTHCTECGALCEHTVEDMPTLDGIGFVRTTCAACAFTVTWAGPDEPGLPNLREVLVILGREAYGAGVS